MLRVVAARLHNVTQTTLLQTIARVPAVISRPVSKQVTETDDEFDARYETFFNRQDIDGWEIRKGMMELYSLDMVPEPKIISAAMRACRRISDYALAVRYLEAVKEKCGNNVKEIYPYIIQEIRPTLDELGINTPEELGYDKPELALDNVFDD